MGSRPSLTACRTAKQSGKTRANLVRQAHVAVVEPNERRNLRFDEQLAELDVEVDALIYPDR